MTNSQKTCTNISCPERKSICCNEPPKAIEGDEGTGYFICSNCFNEFIAGECTAPKEQCAEDWKDKWLKYCAWTRVSGIHGAELDKALVQFIEQTLIKEREKSYADGYTDGAKINNWRQDELDTVRKEARAKIYKDLMEIADRDELEDLRRVTEKYFIN